MLFKNFLFLNLPVNAEFRVVDGGLVVAVRNPSAIDKFGFGTLSDLLVINGFQPLDGIFSLCEHLGIGVGYFIAFGLDKDVNFHTILPF